MGTQHGVQRNKIRSRPLTQEDWEDTGPNGPVVPNLSIAGRSLAGQWAQKCFQWTSDLCCTLCLAPFMKADHGIFRIASFRSRVIHSVLITLLTLTCLHKLVVTIMAFTILPIGTTASVLSYTGFHLQMTAMALGMGLVFGPFLSCELLNSWVPTISQVTTRLRVTYRSPWTYASSSLQVLAIAAASAVAIAIFPALSFMFPTTPIFLLPSLKAAGLVCSTDDWIRELAVQLGCYIFDVGIYAASLTLMCFAAEFIVSEVGFLKLLVDLLR